MMGKRYVIGIDIGGTNFRIGMVTVDGNIHNFKIMSSSILTVNNDAIGNLTTCIRNYIEEFSYGDLLAIAVGFPSTISKDKKVVYSTPNLDGFNNLNIVDPLEKEFDVPVFLDRDVNFLLKWDINNSKVSQRGMILGFYIGTGFGNAICYNGELISGKNGAAGELGHIPVLNGRGLCGCGNIGCIEVYASGKRLSTIRDNYFKDTDITDIFVEKSNEAIIKDYIECLSIPIATEINILDPDFAVIGGGVSQMAGFPKKMLLDAVYRHLRKPYPAENLNIVFSKHNQESGVMGSAYYAYEKLKIKL